MNLRAQPEGKPKPGFARALLQAGRRSRAGFTLAEALAALVFMAIVIPVAVQGVRIASQAGQVAQRKAVAARIAERIINESIVTAQSGALGQRGTIHEGVIDYQWTARTEPWTEGTFKLLTVQVNYPVQGQDYNVTLSTLMPLTQ
jgi:type II secretory pathway pseudopilin PulG